MSRAFSDYCKAVADEVLARAQFERSKDLYEHGAMALNDLQVAQDTEDKAKVDVETTSEHLKELERWSCSQFSPLTKGDSGSRIGPSRNAFHTMTET